ncbi:hypothetical protein Q4591_14650 [Shewanella sp. 3_MG-2023]|uniref:hypothetical protein n=1 Tax=Shewanella sp. 3_MG-2023 TaxID=3062635 RepID=UPI0026E17911|nr:hypothetical protein [Shewanella sp. 3_MG-2023]MDO6776593.1 hypothetical protein [Shewanella sp. 3_MG-2023]
MAVSMNITSSIKSIILFFLLFFSTVGPVIMRFGSLGDTLSLANLCNFILFALLMIKKEVKIATPIAMLLSLFMCFYFYNLLIIVLNGAIDTTYLVRSIRIFLNILGGVSLVYLYVWHFKEEYIEKIVLYLFSILTIHGMIMLIQFVSADFREVVYSITEPEMLEANMSFRMAGLTNSGAAGTSLIQFIPILMTPLIANVLKKGFFKQLFIIGAVIINVLAILVSGRTGLFFSLIFLPMLCFWNFRLLSILTIKRDFLIKFLFVSFFILIASLYYFQNSSSSSSSSSSLEVTSAEVALERTSREFENIVTPGRRSTITILFDHIKIPSDTNQLLFGNSIYERENSSSDIGFIRDLFGIGVIGVIISLLFYIYVILEVFFRRSTCPLLAKFIIIFTLSLILAHAKEPFLFTRYFLTVTVVLFASLILFRDNFGYNSRLNPEGSPHKSPSG